MTPKTGYHQKMVSWRLVRFLITANVSACNLFFAIKNARVNKICRRTNLQNPLTNYGSISYNHSTGNSNGSDDSRFKYNFVRRNSQLPRMDKNLRRYYYFSFCYNIYLLIKHIIVSLLRLDLFARFRFLDCLLVGRFIVNGRTIEVAHYCCCYLTIFKLIWYYLILWRQPTYRLPVVEFLLNKWDDVAFWSSSKSSESLAPFSNQRHRKQDQSHSSMFEYQNPFLVHRRQGELQNNKLSCRLRPNRTTEAWIQLAGSSVRFCSTFCTIWIVMLIIFLRMGLPISMNRRGFELNYRFCLQWMTNERRSRISPAAADPSNSTFSTISWFDSFKDHMFSQMQAEREGSDLLKFPVRDRFNGMVIEDILMPFGDFVDFNIYHVVRFTAESLDATIIYVEIALLLASMLFLVNIYSHDLIIYCSHLNERLGRLIAVLRTHSNIQMDVNETFYHNKNAQFTIISLPPQFGGTQTTLEIMTASFQNQKRRHQHKHSTNVSTPTTTQLYVDLQQPRVFWSLDEPFARQKNATKILKLDIINIQAMIADLFALVDQYNEYNSLQMIYLVTFWLSYSAMVSSWIFIPGNKSPKIEWYILHSFATIYLFMLMAKFSEVKRQFRKLYKLIVIAMALDENYRSTKSTWGTLLKFYSPIPMYCFRIIKSVELDILFGLKMVSWLATALLVASSFFTVYNIN